MTVREKISQSKMGGLALFGVTIAAAVMIFVWSNGSWSGRAASRTFFSSDDGKSYFADSVSKVPPFEANGKEAVQAFVFRAGKNEPFVGYLLTYKPETARKLSELLGKANDTSIEIMNARAAALVKRPGEAKWQPITSAEGGKIVSIAAPARQTGELQSVDP